MGKRIRKNPSVVDLKTFSEIQELEVGVNPVHLHADNQGDIYVVSVTAITVKILPDFSG